MMKEIYRWRVCLGRQIRIFGGFSGQRAADRRLKLLQDNGYVEKKRILYGVPSLYTLTYKSKKMLNLNTRKEKIKIEQITHDILVLDTVIYLMYKDNIPLTAFTSEKELHSQDGFSNRVHRPDFLYTVDDKTYCVEIELNLKAKARLEKNIKSNFLNYDFQKWIVPCSKIKIRQILEDNSITYPTIEILSTEEVSNFVNNL